MTSGHLALASDDDEEFGLKSRPSIVPHSSRERPGDIKK
jgi:hypothetical protein